LSPFRCYVTFLRHLFFIAGTGKSTVIYQALKFLPIGEVVLVTCIGNKAVDAVAEKVSRGTISSDSIPFIVYGNDDRLGLVARQWTLDAQVERDTRVMKLVRQLETTGPGALWNSLNGELGKAKAEVRRQLVNRAQAILCTVASASRSLIGSKEFLPVAKRITTAVLDEAGTSPEAALPCLLMLPQLRRIIAIGDHKQLSPFTHWKYPNFLTLGAAGGAGVDGMDSSILEPPRGFFQRLVSALPMGSVPTLTKQYRMQPDSLTQYVSRTSYDGALTTDEAIAAARRAADPVGLYWLAYNPGPLGAESAPETGGTSKVNALEATLALQAYRQGEAAGYLCNPRKRRGAGALPVGRSVAVITLYKAQEMLLRKVFRDAGIHERENGPGAESRRGSLRIMTVDQAQGSEADVVILSLVRSNGRGEIGFASNKNRLNVAVSRARERLVVIGDSWTMSTDPRWAELAGVSQQLSDVAALPAMADR
jgi:ATP-dependent RNA/DNA helicase IGHMBP2